MQKGLHLVSPNAPSVFMPAGPVSPYAVENSACRQQRQLQPPHPQQQWQESPSHHMHHHQQQPQQAWNHNHHHYQQQQQQPVSPAGSIVPSMPPSRVAFPRQFTIAVEEDYAGGSSSGPFSDLYPVGGQGAAVVTSVAPAVTSSVTPSPKPTQSPMSVHPRSRVMDPTHMSQEVDLVFYDLSASQTPKSPAQFKGVSPRSPAQYEGVPPLSSGAQQNHRKTSSVSDYVSPMRGLGFPHAERATVMPAGGKHRRAKQGSSASLPAPVEHSDDEYLNRAMTAERQQPGEAVMQASRDMRRTKTDGTRAELSPIITPRAAQPWGPPPVTRQPPGSAGRSRTPPPATSRQHAGQTMCGSPGMPSHGGRGSPNGNVCPNGAAGFQGPYHGGRSSPPGMPHAQPPMVGAHNQGSLPKGGTGAMATAGTMGAGAVTGGAGGGPAGLPTSCHHRRPSSDSVLPPFKPVTVIASKARHMAAAQDGSHPQAHGPTGMAAEVGGRVAARAVAPAAPAGQSGVQQKSGQKGSSVKNPSPSTLFRAQAQAAQASHSSQASQAAHASVAAGASAASAGSAPHHMQPRRRSSVDDSATGTPFFFPLSSSEDSSAEAAQALALRANVSPIRGGVLISALRSGDIAAASGHAGDAGSGNSIGNPKPRVKVMTRKSLGIHPQLMQAGAVTAVQAQQAGEGAARTVAALKRDGAVPRASSTPPNLDSAVARAAGSGTSSGPGKKLERTLCFKEGSENSSLQSASREAPSPRQIQQGGRGEEATLQSQQQPVASWANSNAGPTGSTGTTSSNVHSASAATGMAGGSASATTSRFGQAMASGLRALGPGGSPPTSQGGRVLRHSVSNEADVQFGPGSPMGDAPPLENIMRAMTDTRRGGMKKKGYTDPFLSPRKVKFDSNVQVHVYPEEQAKAAVSRIPRMSFM